jgi:glucose/arabinose dehydrogenase
MDFYRGDLFPYWQNHLLVGALKYEDVRLLEIRDGRVLHEEIILKNAGRVRDVECGPDGAVYVVLNDPGTVLRLTSLGETKY